MTFNSLVFLLLNEIFSECGLGEEEAVMAEGRVFLWFGAVGAAVNVK